MQTISVTQVLSTYQDFSSIKSAVLEYAAWRGKEVHRICGSIALGLPYFSEIPSSCAGYVLSFQQWFERSVECVHLVERQLSDEVFGFTGTPDLIVTMKGESALTLVDLKTPTLLQRVWQGQLAAYRHLARKNGYPVERVFSLRLDRDGKLPKVKEYQDDGRDLAAFMAALTAHRYFRQAA